MLNALQKAGDDETTWIPRYDKSERGGRGDRAPRELWTQVIGRPDIILLEGDFYFIFQDFRFLCLLCNLRRMDARIPTY